MQPLVIGVRVSSTGFEHAPKPMQGTRRVGENSNGEAAYKTEC